MVDKIFEVVADIHSRGTTVLLVEQNASRALGLANRGYVMESGEITMSGEAKALLERPQGAGGLPGRVTRAAAACSGTSGVGPARKVAGAARGCGPLSSPGLPRRKI